MRDITGRPVLYQPQSNGECRYAASAAASRGVGLFWYEIPALAAASENVTLPCWASARPAAAAHKHAARPARCRIRVSMIPSSGGELRQRPRNQRGAEGASPGASDRITRNE